jgi:membrane protein YqaA with SNARE-associated domain
MWYHYFLVFLGAFFFDVVPFPFPPAFTIMVTLQILYDLNIWAVIFIGVAGSILGRYVLTLYIPKLAGKIFKRAKTEDIEFLGNQMHEKGWRSQVMILAYSLLPLPTTPLFLAAGIARLKPIKIIPAFFVGKFISDTIAVTLGNYATKKRKSNFRRSINNEKCLQYFYRTHYGRRFTFYRLACFDPEKKIYFGF